jgi:multidrug efflux system membrane fusion protein
MDGDLKTLPGAGAPEDTERERRDAIARPRVTRARQVAWFAIVAVLVAVVLGGLYGFNRYRENAIANFFARNTPPPAAISAVVAEMAMVPRTANGIGSLAAVRQVTITPEAGGRVVEIYFEPGADVKAGDKLVQLNDAPERGDLANYEAQARWAAVSLQRARELAKNQYAAQATVDQTQSQLDQARAQILKTEAVIAQKLIRAPFAGRLGVRQIDLGQVLTAGTPIVTLTDLSKLYVNFTLPSQTRSELTVGQKVEVTADALPGRRFDAVVTTIEPQINPSTRTIAVQATMANPGNSLLPGMFVNAAVQLPPGPEQVVLPETAVDYTLYGDSVYVIRPEGSDANGKPVLKAERVPVTTGARWGNKVAILDGVKPGERVVAAGQNKVQNGGAVIVTGNPPPVPPASPPPQ